VNASDHMMEEEREGGEPDATGRVAGPAGRMPRAAAILATVALFVLIGSLCLTRITDTDIWWHLATGDEIRRTGDAPSAEMHSYTALGRRWIDIHWLFQSGISLLYEKGGFGALTAFRAAIILALFGLLYARGRRWAGPILVGWVLFLAALACQERFLVRPEIVSWILMAIVLAALDRALETDSAGRRAIVWLGLPVLQILWVNVQGLFILGPVLLVLALLASALRFLRRPIPRDAGATFSDLLVAVAIVTLACLLNPYGPAALRLPFEQFFVHLGGESLLSKSIAEFQPPLGSGRVTPAIVAFVVFAALTIAILLVSLGIGFRRVRPFDVLVAAATLYAATRARRNIPIFVVAAAPICIRYAASLLPALLSRAGSWAPIAGGLRGARARRIAVVAAPALLAAFCVYLTYEVVTNRFFLRQPTERWWGVGTIPYYFPDEAARFVSRAGLAGNVFHSMAVGGFLIHAWDGRRPVFIDGRNDPYLSGVLETYLKAIADPAAFEEAVQRYQITAVLWPHERALEGTALLGYLARGRGWVLAHLDAGASVYLRAEILSAARLAEGPFRPGIDPRVVYEGLARQLEESPFGGPPIREIALGEFFSVSGDPRGAEFFYRSALDRLPRSAPLLHDYALSLERQGRMPEARAAHERALEVDPRFLPSLAASGWFLLEEGKVEEATRRLEEAYRGGDRSLRLLTARARLFDRRGDVEKAVDAYREALRSSPASTALLREVARFYGSHGDDESAVAMYGRAAEADPDDPAVARETAALLLRLGRTSAALDVARAAAQRALARIERERQGVWPGSEGQPRGREEDRRLLLEAARLETASGNRSRASGYLEALTRAGLLEDSTSDPVRPAPSEPRPK
jgi:tetratricopeptide (TPR) repeat protein